MQTLNQLSNRDFSKNLLLNSLNEDDKSSYVYDFSNGYNTLDLLVSMINKHGSTQVTGLNGVYEKPIMGVSRVIAMILATTSVGANLKITFTDPNYDLFRVKDAVMDSSANRTIGRVIAKGAGYIIIEPVEGAFNTSTQFIVGTSVLSGWDASGNRGSGGKTSIYEYPEYVRNCTAITRETVELFRRDMSKTWVKFKGDYWYSAQDQLAVNRFSRQIEYKSWFSKFAMNKNSSVEGDVNFNGGLKWAILDPERGGVYKPLYNAMTQEDFENFISAIADRQASTNVELTFLVGRSALRQIQQFTTPFIQYGGKDNTFGGATVEGLDVRQYNVAGIACKFIMAPILNDHDSFPDLSTIPGILGTKMQNTMVALDTAMYESVGGGQLPAMEKIYFGEEEYIYGYVPGLIGKAGIDPSNVLKSGQILATNDKDAVSLQLYTDAGIDIMANRMGWLELAQ